MGQEVTLLPDVDRAAGGAVKGGPPVRSSAARRPQDSLPSRRRAFREMS